MSQQQYTGPHKTFLPLVSCTNHRGHSTQGKGTLCNSVHYCTHGSKISCEETPSFCLCNGMSNIYKQLLTADILIVDQCSQWAERVLDPWVLGIRMVVSSSYPFIEWLVLLSCLLQPSTAWAPANCVKLAK